MCLISAAVFSGCRINDEKDGSSEIRIDAGGERSATISDTVALHGTVSTGPGSSVKLAWNIGPGGSFIDVASGDTVIVTGAEPGMEEYVLRGTDSRGHEGYDTLRIRVVDDVPVLTLSVDPVPASRGGGYRISTKAADQGRIVRWEWSIGTDNYALGGGGDTIFIPKVFSDAVQKCRVQATDEDGNVGKASRDFMATPWAFEGEAPFGGEWNISMAESGGKLYAIGIAPGNGRPKKGALAAFDPATGQWTALDFPMPKPFHRDVRMVTLAGKIYVFGGTRADGENDSVQPALDFSSLWRYDPLSSQWRQMSSAVESLEGSVGAALDGKLYVMTGGAYWTGFSSYDPVTEQWSKEPELWKHTGPTREWGGRDSSRTWSGAIAAAAGKIWLVGLRESQAGLRYLYDPVARAWSQEEEPDFFPGGKEPGFFARAAVTWDGRIYALGSFPLDDKGFSRQGLMEFDPAARTWRGMAGPPYLVEYTGAAASNGRIFALGGERLLYSYDIGSRP